MFFENIKTLGLPERFKISNTTLLHSRLILTSRLGFESDQILSECCFTEVIHEEQLHPSVTFAVIFTIFTTHVYISKVSFR
jgi:hypothetical protein